jgi:hypothetical protein
MKEHPADPLDFLLEAQDGKLVLTCTDLDVSVCADRDHRGGWGG